MSKTAVLRCCASCMWVFRLTQETHLSGCPQCGFGHYGARFALGDSCYRALATQAPWVRNKLADERRRLEKIVRDSLAVPARGAPHMNTLPPALQGLTAFNQFLNYRLTPMPGGKNRKEAIGREGYRVDPTDPKHWMTYDEAASTGKPQDTARETPQ